METDLRLDGASEIFALDSQKEEINQPSNPLDMGKEDVKRTEDDDDITNCRLYSLPYCTMPSPVLQPALSFFTNNLVPFIH